MTVDILAIGSHPDDLELSCGGTLAKMVKQGHTVALADVTQGELGTRGTKEIRADEAEAAATILGAVTRKNLGIADGNIQVNQENLNKIISLIRELKPKLLLIPHSIERHPDHVHTHHLCKEAWFYAGLQKIETTHSGSSQQHFRPQNYFEYMQWYEFRPSFVIDISDTYELKMEAVKAHSSQFHNPKSKEPETILSRPEFMNLVEARARYYGETIGVRYGEPFYSWKPLGINDFFHLLYHKG